MKKITLIPNFSAVVYNRCMAFFLSFVNQKCFKFSTCTTCSFFPKKVRANYEDAAAVNARKIELIRSESDNWRTSRDEHNGEDDDGGWRPVGSRRDNERRCPPSPGMLHAILFLKNFVYFESFVI